MGGWGLAVLYGLPRQRVRHRTRQSKHQAVWLKRRLPWCAPGLRQVRLCADLSMHALRQSVAFHANLRAKLLHG